MDQSGNVIELKLADFGLACEVTKPLYAVCGTPTYVAPEILLETGYGLKVSTVYGTARFLAFLSLSAASSSLLSTVSGNSIENKSFNKDLSPDLIS